MNYRKLVVFDFETDGVNPEECNPVQVAAIVIDPRTLTPIKGAEFNSMMRPPDIEKDGYLTDAVKSTIAWHAKNQGVTSEKIIEIWKSSPDQKTVWKQFSSFVNRFNGKNTKFWAPVPCGANIRNFDLIISDRLNESYNIKTMFWPRDRVDLLDFCFYWFEDYEDGPKNYKVDTLREYFGIPDRGAHDALVDVQDCAEMIVRFIRLHRRSSKNVKFRGAFKL